MQLKFLLTSGQRSIGAMFSKKLTQEVLAFVYPTDAARTFHTWFCPPLRIVALSADGQIQFDEIISKWRLIKMPACRYVIETDPQVDYHPFIDTIISTAPELPQSGALAPDTRMDSLLFALLAEAVADIRRIRETHKGKVRSDVQRKKFEAWERGQIVSSAGFILDFSQAWSLPEGAVKLSHSVLLAEEPYFDEIVAASVAGIPWRHEFPNACIRCGKPGSWRPILAPKPDTPLEVSWRYQRPENAVPICHHCTETLGLLRNHSMRIDLVCGLWGPRFEALWQWHKALQRNCLPAWDPYAHPLWPQEFGGETWETGSGSLQFAEPRPPQGVARDTGHLSALRRALYSKPFRGRQPGETHLLKLLEFSFDIQQGETP